MKPLKYFLLGLAVDATLLLALYLYGVIVMAVSLRGKCPDIGLDSFERDCAPWEAARAYLLWPLFMMLFAAQDEWWWAAPALLVLPLAGLCYGLSRS